MTSRTATLTSTGANSGSPRFRNVRSPRMTSAARRPCVAMLSTISVTRADSRAGDVSSIFTASAFATMAVSGCPSSWANDAASSPAVASRPTRASASRCRWAASSALIRSWISRESARLRRSTVRRRSCTSPMTQSARDAKARARAVHVCHQYGSATRDAAVTGADHGPSAWRADKSNEYSPGPRPEVHGSTLGAGLDPVAVASPKSESHSHRAPAADGGCRKPDLDRTASGWGGELARRGRR